MRCVRVDGETDCRGKIANAADGAYRECLQGARLPAGGFNVSRKRLTPRGEDFQGWWCRWGMMLWGSALWLIWLRDADIALYHLVAARALHGMGDS